MSPDSAHFLWYALGRLLLAAGLGAAVGLERETQRKAAGLRTIMVICFGSALFTLLSEAIAAARGGDPTRISGQLVTGIGFLGAGAIIQARGIVVGLTTAATIFAMAAIGMACGAGLSLLAIVSTLVLLAVLIVLRWVEQVTEQKPQPIAYSLTTTRPDQCIADLNTLARQHRIVIRDLRIEQNEHRFQLKFLAEASEGTEPEIIREFQQIGQRHA